MATFVLVPGAWLGSWVWKRLTPLLRDKGHHVYPVTLTGMGERKHLTNSDYGIEVAIQDVINVIEFEDLNDVVLVGHSFAGKVVAAVADRIPDRIKLILYLDAARPERTRSPQLSFDPTEEFGPLPQGSTGVPLNDDIIDAIGSDVSGEDRKWLLEKASPWPVKLGIDPINLSEKFDGISSAYILCSEAGDPVDEILKGKWGELHGPARVMESGHWPMITKPVELAEALLELSNQ